MAQREGTSVDAGVGGASAVFSGVLRGAGVPHAFSTRHGGVSSGMFDSLNFGNPGDLAPTERDPAANIRRNFEVLAAAMEQGGGGRGVGGREIVEVHQVHGAAVCVVRRGEPTPRDASGRDVKADAIVTDDPRRLAAVRVADCTPVLLSTLDGRVVGAAHAGWRGVVGGVVIETIRGMRELGSSPACMGAAIGPCIEVGAFEVGPEVAAEFHRVFGMGTAHVRPGAAPGKSMVDLKGAIREQLLGTGIPAERIDVLPHCTVRESTDFFSHRGGHGRSGRMVGIIGPRAV